MHSGLTTNRGQRGECHCPSHKHHISLCVIHTRKNPLPASWSKTPVSQPPSSSAQLTCSTLGAGFTRGTQAAPRGRVTRHIAGAVTEMLAPLAVRPFLAACVRHGIEPLPCLPGPRGPPGRARRMGGTCVTALAPQPGGTPAAPGGGVTASPVLAVTALPAALSMETRGTAWHGKSSLERG